MLLCLAINTKTSCLGICPGVITATIFVAFVFVVVAIAVAAAATTSTTNSLSSSSRHLLAQLLDLINGVLEEVVLHKLGRVLATDSKEGKVKVM